MSQNRVLKMMLVVLFTFWVIFAMLTWGYIDQREGVIREQEEEINQLRGELDSMNFELSKCEEGK